jgi:Do/DeqQ family serine protease
MRLRPLLLVSLVALAAACSRPGEGRAQTPPLSGPGSTPLAAPNRSVPPDAATMKLSFAPLVRRAAPAVVNISSKRVVRQQVDPFFAFFGGMGAPRERVEGSLGSGAIVRADGLIVTNHHVVEGGQEITVSLADRREFPARILLDDPRSDLAVLKIDVGSEKLPVLPLADRPDLQVGDLVLAIGDPFGVGQTVTNGIVSALSRTGLGGDAGDFSSYIQTDAAINPGNSGGPLVDMAGNIVGLNTFILSRSGSSSGVGFAVPAPLVRRVVETAVNGGKSVKRPWLGLRLQAIDADTARSLGLDRPQGVVVAGVYPGGPADRAGLQPGDVIVAADGAPVNDEGALNFSAATHRAGETVRLSVRHAGAARTVEVRLESPPASPARDERTLTGRQPLAGATVITLSPAAADEYGLDPFAQGVVVTAVTGIAASQGFRPGDIIRSVNGEPVRSTAGLQGALQAGRWRITLERGGQTVTANF